jgi:hypothetical protein|tara:strand:+ start:1239 stop:1427 length:189 start_codon:yes stop_codon:yes gene_type:complete
MKIVKDFNKLKQVISHPDNEKCHLGGIYRYTTLFFDKWGEEAEQYDYEINKLHLELVMEVYG